MGGSGGWMRCEFSGAASAVLTLALLAAVLVLILTPQIQTPLALTSAGFIGVGVIRGILMSLRAVGFGAILRPRIQASIATPFILRLCDWLQVVRVYAPSMKASLAARALAFLVAGVIEPEPQWHGSNKKLVGHLVCFSGSFPKRVAYIYGAVPMAIHPAGPPPAPVRLDGDILKKLIHQRNFYFRFSCILTCRHRRLLESCIAQGHRAVSRVVVACLYCTPKNAGVCHRFI